MQTTNHPESFPILPKKFSFPLKIIPDFLHNKALVTTLNKIFKKDIAEGELDFLQNKVIQIAIEDAEIKYRFSLNENKLIPAPANQKPI